MAELIQSAQRVWLSPCETSAWAVSKHTLCKGLGTCLLGFRLDRGVGHTRLRFCIGIKYGAGRGDHSLHSQSKDLKHRILECWVWVLDRQLISGGLICSH